jgi:hypothetical protein
MRPSVGQTCDSALKSDATGTHPFSLLSYARHVRDAGAAGWSGRSEVCMTHNRKTSPPGDHRQQEALCEQVDGERTVGLRRHEAGALLSSCG